MDVATLESLDEYFESDGVCAVEWPAAVPVDLTARASRIVISLVDETNRRLTLDTEDERLLAAFAASPATRR